MIVQHLFLMLCYAAVVSAKIFDTSPIEGMASWSVNSTSVNNSYRKLVDEADNSSRDKCLIVVNDKIRGHLNWMQDWFQKSAATNCRHAVRITENKGEMNKADVILFHAPSHHGGAGKSVQRFRRKQGDGTFRAITAMVSMEQPKYAPVMTQMKYLMANIDLMVTYNLAHTYPNSQHKLANLPITYYPLNIVSPQAIMHPGRPFSLKTGYDTGVGVALFTSNCGNAGAKERYRYIEELMKYVKVHSYGKCFKNREEPQLAEDPRWPAIAQRRSHKIRILSHYKFYLAFENSPILDYVSEKVFEGLIAGTLPIYRGASSIAYFMPSNDSFIDANNLSPRQLADKIIALGKDEAAYNAYFQFKTSATAGPGSGETAATWRSSTSSGISTTTTTDSKIMPAPAAFEQMALMSYVHPNVLCRICEYALPVVDS